MPINPYHLIGMDDSFSTVRILDGDGNIIDPNSIKVDPEWHDWMFSDAKDYRPPRSDDDEIGDAITANNCGIGPEGFEAGNSCAKGGVGGTGFSAEAVAVMERAAATKQTYNTIQEEWAKAAGIEYSDLKQVHEMLYAHNVKSGGEIDTKLAETWKSDTSVGHAMRKFAEWQEYHVEHTREPLSEEDKHSTDYAAKQAEKYGWDRVGKNFTGGSLSPTFEDYARRLEALNAGELVVYRKGALDKNVISTTGNVEGAKSGGSHFKPDRWMSYGDMRKAGYRLIAGAVGVVSNVSAQENEYIWIKDTQPLTANNCGTGANGFEAGNTCAGGGGGWQPSMSEGDARQWSSGSKVQGVFYHGAASSEARSTITSEGFKYDSSSPNSRAAGDGIYLTSDKSYAERFSKASEGVLHTVVSMSNPSVMSPAEVGRLKSSPEVTKVSSHLRDEAQKGMTFDQTLDDTTDYAAKAMTKVLRDKGHDGLVMQAGDHRVVVAYKPEQVVTINNCGIAQGGFQPGNTCAAGGDGSDDYDWHEDPSYDFEEVVGTVSKQNYKIFKKGNVSGGQEHALSVYTGSAYKEINAYLKTGSHDSDNDLDDLISEMDSFLEEHAGSIKPPTLYRGFRSRSHDKMLDNFKSAVESGKLVELGPAFQSMSADRKTAADFVTVSSLGSTEKRGFMLEIESRSAVPVNNIDEFEYIPPRKGVAYEVVSVTTGKTNIYKGHSIDLIKLREVDASTRKSKPSVDVTRNEQPQDTGKFEADDDDIHFIDAE